VNWPRVLAILGLVVAAIGLLVFSAQRLKADGAAARIAAEEKQHASDIAAAAAETHRIETNQVEHDREAARFADRAAVGQRDAAVAADRLQQRFAAINAGCVPDHPSAVASGPSASSAADLRADVLRRAVQAAERIASAADSFRGPGVNAEAQYDGLKRP
jgi:hypothetical protein